ncbi:hypothetical protein AB0395_33155 [Streptosporangium sp. NPDC051023]|uniref:hypothetical protein n=1 Tax=Streptosporangium sp. NPDC051023 TaxID=3155410 RepID=UPI0034503260
MSEDTDRLARIEAKLDVLVVQTTTDRTRLDDHEARLREMERTGVASDVADHETRIRSIERWRYALPIASIATLLTGTAAIIAAIKGG